MDTDPVLQTGGTAPFVHDDVEIHFRYKYRIESCISTPQVNIFDRSPQFVFDFYP